MRDRRWTLLVLMLFAAVSIVACADEKDDASPRTTRAPETTTSLSTTSTTFVAPPTQPLPPDCRFVTTDELAGIVGTSTLWTADATPGACRYQHTSPDHPANIVTVTVAYFPGKVGLTPGEPVSELARTATWDDSLESLQVQMPSGVAWILVDLPSDQVVGPRATAIAVFRAAESRIP